MLWLDSKSDKPDFEWFRQFMTKRAAEGIKVERPLEIEKTNQRLAEEAAEWLKRECGIQNPNSTKQIVEYMENCNDQEIYNCCCIEKKVKNAYTGEYETQYKLSSAEEGLVQLVALGRKWAMQLLKYRSSNGILKAINSVMDTSDMNGLIHPNIGFQKTNRVNYTGPALININKELLWHIIKPYKDGDYLWSADIKNQEPWILAHMTGAKKLIELAGKASDSGCSLYRAVYADIFGHDIESEEAYTEMKTAWNMLTYGGTLQGLKQRLRIIDAEKVYRYFNGIKELSDYRGKTYGLKRYNIQSAKTVFGTTVTTDAVGGHLQRSLMDIPIQGTGADILAMLTKHIVERTYDEGIADYIKVYFTRHDEIIFEVDKEWQESIGAEAVKEEIAELTQHRIDDWVPFGVDVEQLNEVV